MNAEIVNFNLSNLTKNPQFWIIIYISFLSILFFFTLLKIFAKQSKTKDLFEKDLIKVKEELKLLKTENENIKNENVKTNQKMKFLASQISDFKEKIEDSYDYLENELIKLHDFSKKNKDKNKIKDNIQTFVNIKNKNIKDMLENLEDISQM